MAGLHLENVTIELPAHLATTSSFRTVLARFFGQRQGLNRRYNPILRDISLVLSDGDRLGIVGANGAGKSTMLRCMAGIYEPTRGRVRRNGSTKALLGAPSGLHIELTGLEFIRLSARIRQLSSQATEALIEDIKDFTELGVALNRPIRTYSAGMLARLSFAINTSEDPDILLMDEWLGAGDARFVERASNRLKRFISSSAILVIATHSDALIRTWCNKVLVLNDGLVVTVDEPEAALKARDACLFGDAR